MPKRERRGECVIHTPAAAGRGLGRVAEREEYQGGGVEDRRDAQQALETLELGSNLTLARDIYN